MVKMRKHATECVEKYPKRPPGFVRLLCSLNYERNMTSRQSRVPNVILASKNTDIRANLHARAT
jgi:hypothetical protein